MYVPLKHNGWYFKHVATMRKAKEVLRRQIKAVYVRKC